MIGESGLAGVNRRLEMQKAARAARRLRGDGARRGRSASSLLSVSYGRNRTYIAETAAEVAKLAATCRRWRRTARRRSAAAAPRRGARRRRGGRPVSRRRAVVDAVGTVPGQLDRQRRARRLRARARRHAAAARRGADRGAPRRVRARARKAVRVPQGLPDARRAASAWTRSTCSSSPSSNGSAADTPSPEAGASLSQHFQSLLDYGDTPAADRARTPRSSRRRAAPLRQASIPRIIYGRLQAQLRRRHARARRGSTWPAASASNR